MLYLDTATAAIRLVAGVLAIRRTAHARYVMLMPDTGDP
jgi:hypothetical protein